MLNRTFLIIFRYQHFIRKFVFAVTVLAGKLRPLIYPLESRQLREPSTANGLKCFKKSQFIKKRIFQNERSSVIPLQKQGAKNFTFSGRRILREPSPKIRRLDASVQESRFSDYIHAQAPPLAIGKCSLANNLLILITKFPSHCTRQPTLDQARE